MRSWPPSTSGASSRDCRSCRRCCSSVAGGSAWRSRPSSSATRSTGGGMNRMEHAVHLEDVRCDGQGHGGCQAACLVYWKEAWLKRVERRGGQRERSGPAAATAWLQPAVADPGDPQGRRTADRVRSCSHARRPSCCARPRSGSRHGSSGSMSRTCGPPTPGFFTVLRSVAVGAFNEYQDLSVKLLPRWLRIHQGKRFPFLDGTQRRTPTETLDLQPGELVRIKSKEEIVRDPGHGQPQPGHEASTPRCSGTAAARRAWSGRVERIIDEPTRQDAGAEEPVHRARGRDLPRRLPPALPAGHLPLLARDLAGAGVAALTSGRPAYHRQAELPPPARRRR